MAPRERTTHFITMIGGNGPSSYSQNSTYQKAAVEAAKEKISQAIFTKLDLENPYFNFSSKPFTIADFGCSTGPNTFLAVHYIIEALDVKYKKEITKPNSKNIEFHVFFNDHPNNDFNTLFKCLPPTRQYTATGVPGSFFNRVLPKGSLHVGYCSYALHFLSQVPKGVANRDSPAWNKDIHCTGFVKAVAEAYLEQFKSDMDTFLNARAQELVPGGLLLLLGSCLPDGVLMSETMKGMMIDCIGSCLNDMAKSGIISQTKVDSFNYSVYFAHVSEFNQAIEENGNFTIEFIERLSHANEEFPLDVKFLTDSTRATFAIPIGEQFGKEVEVETMERFEEKVAERLPEFAKAKNGIQFFIVLRRN